MIGWASFEILSKEIKSLLGERPSDELLLAIRKTAQKACKQPLYIHHIHLHKYGNHSELSFHIKLPPEMTIEVAHNICSTIEDAIKKEFGFETTVHPEPIHW
jgi:divalent metal cation (Fe/Co/Zn/Cd) transporter